MSADKVKATFKGNSEHPRQVSSTHDVRVNDAPAIGFTGNTGYRDDGSDYMHVHHATDDGIYADYAGPRVG